MHLRRNMNPHRQEHFVAALIGGRLRRAFTLIEVMVVIALLGGLAAILAYGASQILIDRGQSAEEVFWGAVGEARKFALLNEVDVTLQFDAENQRFIASALGQARSFPVPLEEVMELEFLGVNEGDQTVLIGGALVETNVIDSVTFFGDGTCVPFRARLAVAERSPVLLEIDPWTCAPVLREEGSRF